jgi:hypothetical protein
LVRTRHVAETTLPKNKNIDRSSDAKSVGTIDGRNNEAKFRALGNGSSGRIMCRVRHRIVPMRHLPPTLGLPKFDVREMRVRPTLEIGCDAIRIYRRLRSGKLSTTIRSFETCLRSVRRS